jgi:uncharacterized coiled-coil DUF342 family protein
MVDIRKGISLDDDREVSVESVRRFVKDLDELTGKVKDARSELKEAVQSNDEIEKIDDSIKSLRDDRKQVIATNAVLVSYANILSDTLDERKQLIDDAKSDGIPHKEIDIAIKMLKSDVAPDVVTQIFTNIAHLVD